MVLILVYEMGHYYDTISFRDTEYRNVVWLDRTTQLRGEEGK